MLGHLDLIRRYDPAGECPFTEIRDIVAAVLERVIADGKGIELNTSGIRYKLNGFMPSCEIFALYRDLGGTIVTTGSDSHKPEHLGAYLRAAQNELASLGFDSFCTYEHRQPVFHKIG